ncbi:malto-oligosyltrehalose trehalohydrolase [Pseudomonas mangiferae]|uniref:Malto-oligosyltrehalose trehalohydrolase n=1 Tax=Pseudomonas mangiferae TaxID=2593654 RepID=A0A553GVL2_9PSED|nr:malto-oligosyltrehalose trehalohydrolase [Pseudomonas mangiferae]TRX73544.1 malto-oligosyltrehalose trehalohydrolase [Pseudomonas mangiferae]
MEGNARFSAPHGAQWLGEQRTRFSLWAPDAGCVETVIEGQPHPLQAQPDGWHSAELPARPGSRYRFRIDGQLDVPDPASRAQAGDVHDESVVVNPGAYPWRNIDWKGRPWHECVLYEVHVGLLGGFRGVEAHLPALAHLGITAIELMPLNDFPGERNWGYDGVLPFAPDSAYGTPDELRHLVDRAHDLGLMVFVDVVYNHFGPDGNYLGQYAKGFFRHDIQTPWGDAIDFRQRPVRDFFLQNALMWLQDYRVDGLRLDAVHAISEKDFLVELAAEVRKALVPARHVHLVLENEHNDARLLEAGFDAQWNDDGHNVLHAMLTGEREAYYADFAEDRTAKLARCLGEGFIYQGESTRRGETRGEPSAHLPPTAFVLFLQNHDQTGNRAFGERLIDLADPDALRAATTLLLLSPMIPLLFMGEEWGSRQPFLFFTDHHDELAVAVREGRRNEFREFAAFADETTRARIPDPNAAATFDASRPAFAAYAQDAEHEGWNDFYRQLLALRHGRLVPHLPGSVALGAEVIGDGAISARWRLGNGHTLRIDLNLSDADYALAAPQEHAPLFISRNDALADYRQGRLAPRLAVVCLENRDA